MVNKVKSDTISARNTFGNAAPLHNSDVQTQTSSLKPSLPDLW